MHEFTSCVDTGNKETNEETNEDDDKDCYANYIHWVRVYAWIGKSISVLICKLIVNLHWLICQLAHENIKTSLQDPTPTPFYKNDKINE